MAGAIVGIIWIPFLFGSLTKDGYQEQAYTLSNVLLAETLTGFDEGVFTVPYLLIKHDYNITLEQQKFTLTNTERSDTGIFASFASMDGLTITDVEFTPVLYQWKKTPGSLSIENVLEVEACPELSALPAWTSQTVFAQGAPQASHVLEDTFFDERITVEYEPDLSKTVGGAYLLRWETVDEGYITVVAGEDEVSARLRCIIPRAVTETTLGELVRVVIDPDMSANQGVYIAVPKDIEAEDVADGLRCAYSYLEGGDYNGCR